MKKIIAVCLILALLLCGCSASAMQNILQYVGTLLGYPTVTAFEDMAYIRPDMDAFRQQLDDCMEAAQTETKVNKLMDKIYTLYGTYYDFHTACALSNIHYCQDLTDTYWEEEYNFCTENSAEVDAGMDQLLYALADCSLKDALEQEDFFGEGFFDEYQGDSIWDDTFTELMNQEAGLESEYYALSAQALDADYYSDAYFNTYGAQMAELFVELVALRQKIAAYAGYDSYLQFAYDFYYYRDYTPAQAQQFLDDIQRELVPLYTNLSYDVWSPYYDSCPESDTFAYVEECAAAMGGTVGEAFQLLKEANLYDIAYSENKYDASFEVYLMSYGEPFIFLNASQSARDKLTFAHEFGHFCNDYASGGSMVGVDVAEIFSQSMELLSLFYCENTADLERVKLADSLCTFVEQSAYASFEQQVYSLEGEELTVENVQALYEQVGTAYGFTSWNWDSRDYVMITHFFTNPMYIVSYVVSNDAALQIYQLEKAESGTGAKLFQDSLSTEEGYFLAFVEAAGLQNPFEKGRAAEIRKTMEAVLN